MSQRDDAPASNPSASPHFSEVLEITLQSRRVLKGSLRAAALTFFGGPALARVAAADSNSMS
jgi:secreted PhoX family phosphatase